jgi:hypothetical protein
VEACDLMAQAKRATEAARQETVVDAVEVFVKAVNKAGASREALRVTHGFEQLPRAELDSLRL